MASWLTTNETTIPEGKSDALNPYVQDVSYFFVAKVKAGEVAFRDGELVVPFWKTNLPGGFDDRDGV